MRITPKSDIYSAVRFEGGTEGLPSSDAINKFMKDLKLDTCNVRYDAHDPSYTRLIFFYNNKEWSIRLGQYVVIKNNHTLIKIMNKEELECHYDIKDSEEV